MSNHHLHILKNPFREAASKKFFFLLTYLVLVLQVLAESAFAQSDFSGTVIAESSDPASIFVASPSVVILPDGTYLVSHDWSGPGSKGKTITSVYRSLNKGKTWVKTTDVQNMRWGSLFWHRGALYLMGVVKSFGDIAICRSSDNGLTWTQPLNQETGLLFSGRYHTGPVPVVVHKGRIWRAYEEDPDPERRRDFHALVLSAPEEADLLKASSWVRSNGVRFNEHWVNARRPNWMEGNMVVTPDGKLKNFMRLETWQAPKGTYEITGAAAGIPRYEVGAMLEVSADGLRVEFEPQRGLVHFPGADSKFTIRYDAQSKRYWTLVNKISKNMPGSTISTSPHHQRNVIVLMSSEDLVHWWEHVKVLRWAEGTQMTRKDRFGFQYLDWQFDGEDVVAVSRTAWNGANYHDANLITWHRIENFRTLTMSDSPPELISGTANN